MRVYTITGCGQSETETRFWFVVGRTNKAEIDSILEKLRAAVKGPKEHWGTNTLIELDPSYPVTAYRITYDLHEQEIPVVLPREEHATSMSIVPLTQVGYEYRFIINGIPSSLWELCREMPYDAIKKELVELSKRGNAEYEYRPVFVSGVQ